MWFSVLGESVFQMRYWIIYSLLAKAVANAIAHCAILLWLLTTALSTLRVRFRFGRLLRWGALERWAERLVPAHSSYACRVQYVYAEHPLPSLSLSRMSPPQNPFNADQRQSDLVSAKCTKLSWWTPISTKAPKLACLIPHLLERRLAQVWNVSAPPAKVAVLNSGRGSRPGHPFLMMSVTVGTTVFIA